MGPRVLPTPKRKEPDLLVPCESCGRLIPNDLLRCPGCGAPHGPVRVEPFDPRMATAKAMQQIVLDTVDQMIGEALLGQPISSKPTSLRGR